jgi:hypothetical protein
MIYPFDEKPACPFFAAYKMFKRLFKTRTAGIKKKRRRALGNRDV